MRRRAGRVATAERDVISVNALPPRGAGAAEMCNAMIFVISKLIF